MKGEPDPSCVLHTIRVGAGGWGWWLTALRCAALMTSCTTWSPLPSSCLLVPPAAASQMKARQKVKVGSTPADAASTALSVSRRASLHCASSGCTTWTTPPTATSCGAAARGARCSRGGVSLGRPSSACGVRAGPRRRGGARPHAARSRSTHSRRQPGRPCPNCPAVPASHNCIGWPWGAGGGLAVGLLLAHGAASTPARPPAPRPCRLACSAGEQRAAGRACAHGSRAAAAGPVLHRGGAPLRAGAAGAASASIRHALAGHALHCAAAPHGGWFDDA